MDPRVTVNGGVGRDADISVIVANTIFNDFTIEEVKEIVKILCQALQVREKLLEKKQSNCSWREIFQSCED